MREIVFPYDGLGFDLRVVRPPEHVDDLPLRRPLGGRVSSDFRNNDLTALGLSRGPGRDEEVPRDTLFIGNDQPRIFSFLESTDNPCVGPFQGFDDAPLALAAMLLGDNLYLDTVTVNILLEVAGWNENIFSLFIGVTNP